MSDLLWQKPGVKVDARIQQFLAGEDVILDREFFLFDIQASRAHAQGLQRIGILTTDELAGLERELDVLADDFRAGNFILDEHFEDGHSAIEARLVVVSTEDNLLKGAATQALQNLNLAFGFGEVLGIPL